MFSLVRVSMLISITFLCGYVLFILQPISLKTKKARKNHLEIIAKSSIIIENYPKYIPEPIPNIAVNPPLSCPSLGDKLQFLQDGCRAKYYPSNTNRDLVCPNRHSSQNKDLKSNQDIVIYNKLNTLIPPEMQITVILIRRVDGKPYYQYFSNGTAEQTFQPWSSSKFLAIANAGATLRKASDYQVGLTASLKDVSLGDLITSLHQYDYSFGFSSNALGRYFQNIGDRTKANQLIHEAWLDRPLEETFGSNYGGEPVTLGYAFQEKNGSNLALSPATSIVSPNHLSSLTLAQAMLYLVMHREEPQKRLPKIQWSDLQTLFYGAKDSKKYGHWGGMSADLAIYFQGHDMDYIERRSRGMWRIFSKLGFGDHGELVNVGYACFPVVDYLGNPVSDQGVEFIIAAHLPTGGGTLAERDRIMAKAHRDIIKRIIHNQL